MLRRAALCTALLGASFTFCPPEAWAGTDGVNAVAQVGVLKGKVLDDTGQPVIGATVKVDGADNKGAVTDIDGNFSISGVSSGKVTVTYIGYKTSHSKF